MHWTYTGDAFAQRPSWVAPDAGLWAPEIQHRDGRWLLYFTASDTSLPGGGSAIGVATSTSPTGPWTDTGTPVVAPADNPMSPGERWMLYHAVDRTDPYVTGTTDYTKRPVLLDRLTWRSGWPVVRGGAGPSDTRQPAPAAQPGLTEVTISSRAPSLLPGRLTTASSDDFRVRVSTLRHGWARPARSGQSADAPVLAAPTGR